jgi:hypothetical protein
MGATGSDKESRTAAITATKTSNGFTGNGFGSAGM